MDLLSRFLNQARDGGCRPEVLLSAKYRNPDTLAHFLRAAEDRGLETVDVSVEARASRTVCFQQLLRYDVSSLRLFRLSCRQ